VTHTPQKPSPDAEKGNYQANDYEPLHLRAPVTTKSTRRLPHPE
jgi:hypothetical protein